MRRPLTLAVLALVTLMSACGESSGPPQTRQLTLITGPIEAFQTDVGTSGPSRTDTRAFTARLEDESGRPAGRLDGSVVITDREGRGREVREYRVGHVQYTLRDGTLAIGGVFVSTPNGSVPVRGGIRRPVLGGTGAYWGAQGEVTQTPLTRGLQKSVFDIVVPKR